MKSVKNSNLIVGITGPIGSGKSTVLNYFKTNGFPTISADEVNKNILKVKKHIININELMFNSKDDRLDKGQIKELIFKEPSKKKILENYLHPLIISEIKSLTKKTNKITFVEAALLYESGFDKDVDLVIGVIADKEVIVKRLKDRDNLTGSMIEDILKTQKNQEFLKDNVNYLVNNSGSKEETNKQLEVILREIMEVNNGNL